MNKLSIGTKSHLKCPKIPDLFQLDINPRDVPNKEKLGTCSPSSR
jgi:hypothetical protein